MAAEAGARHGAGVGAGVSSDAGVGQGAGAERGDGAADSPLVSAMQLPLLRHL